MLNTLLNGTPLTFDEAHAFMGLVMTGEVSQTRLAAALAALRVRGETAEEIAGFALAMREAAVTLEFARGPILFDTCGTGGDGANTFNISTSAAFVVAAAGVPVAKHGNRAASSKSGSADVLEALGVHLEASPQTVGEAIEKLGVGFLFARAYHPAMRYAAPVRAELATRTVFNFLGPLTNPAHPTHQVMGVFSSALTGKLAQVMGLLASEGAMVVHGAGLDELTVCGENTVAEFRSGKLLEYTLKPEEVGLERHEATRLHGGDPLENAGIVARVLAGDGTAAQRDVVAFNAGAALFVAGAEKNIRDGVSRALEVLASGEAMRLLERYAEFTRAGVTASSV